ncbi:MAG TPA: AzlC family ABC transporter permease [candidate division Zixibacteria bacterium]|nr:AzlC family ABC transporter permease [candidate division Zixibacteria bacterium]
MLFSGRRFGQGMRAAVPIWIAFVPSSIAWGIAAQTHRLPLAEVVFMSAWVYSGPAQFAVLGPLSEGRPALQVLITGFLMNLRFLPMSAGLAPYFGGTPRLKLLLASHFVSASSFIVPYLQFQKEASAAPSPPGAGQRNLCFFLGVGASSFLVWVAGTAAGYGFALSVPPGFEEALKFILPGYFTGLLAVEARDRTARQICLASLVLAVPAGAASADWGWLLSAAAVATAGWSLERWIARASS